MATSRKEIREIIKELQGSKGELFETGEMLENKRYQESIKTSLDSASNAAKVIYAKAEDFFKSTANSTLSERKLALKEFLVYKNSVESMLDINTETDKRVLDAINMMESSMKRSTSMLSKVSESISSFAREKLGTKSGAIAGGAAGLLMGRSAISGAIGSAVGGSIGFITDQYFKRKDRENEAKLKAAMDVYKAGTPNGVNRASETTETQQKQVDNGSQTNELLTRTNQLLEAALSKAGLGRLAAIEERQAELVRVNEAAAEEARRANEEARQTNERNELARAEAAREAANQSGHHERTHKFLGKIADILGLQLIIQRAQGLMTLLGAGMSAIGAAIGGITSAIGALGSAILVGMGLKKAGGALSALGGVPDIGGSPGRPRSGLLGKTGRFLGKVAKGGAIGLATAGAGMAIDEFVPEGTTGKETGSAALNIAGMAGTGAMIGSIVPVVGTGIGAVIGAAVGAAMTDWTAVIEDTKKIAAKGSEWYETQGKPLLGEVEKKYNEITAWIAEGTNKLFTNVMEWFNSTVVKWFSDKWETIKNNLSSMGNSVVDSAGKAWDATKVNVLGMNPNSVSAPPPQSAEKIAAKEEATRRTQEQMEKQKAAVAQGVNAQVNNIQKTTVTNQTSNVQYWNDIGSYNGALLGMP